MSMNNFNLKGIDGQTLFDLSTAIGTEKRRLKRLPSKNSKSIKKTIRNLDNIDKQISKELFS